MALNPEKAVRRMTSADLDRVLRWRNRPEVRACMFTRDEISAQEHQRWFAAADSDPSRHLLIYEVAGAPTGFASLACAGNSGVADWGFYLAPEAPRGSGTGLGATVLDHAFGVLGLHKVSGRVLAFNAASIGLHEKLGFRREGELRDQHFDGSRYHSVLCYGLLHSEWPSGICQSSA